MSSLTAGCANMVQPEQEVHESELLLILTYTAFMSAFGALVGLLVITRRVSG
jgi:hypothetical protein